MKKLMATAVFVVVALAAGPALAENIPIVGPDTTVGETPGEGPPAPIDGAPGENPALAPPPSEEPAPPPPSEEPAPPPPSEDSVPPPPSEEPIVDTGEVPAEDVTPPAEDKGPGDGGESTSEAPDTSDPVLDTGDNAGGSEDTEDQEAASDDDTALDTGKNSDDKEETGDKEDKKDSHKDKTDDTEQNQDQEADSGDIGQSVDITNTGDNVNMCIGVLQNANTGNSQNQEGVVQDDSEADDVGLEGGSRITVTPQLIVDCRQLILQIVMGQQPTATNSNFKSSQPKSSGVQVRNGGVQARGGAQPRPISTMADARAAQRPNATPRALPRTGGLSGLDIALLGLFAGAPLIGGGLLLRRILW